MGRLLRSNVDPRRLHASLLACSNVYLRLLRVILVDSGLLRSGYDIFQMLRTRSRAYSNSVRDVRDEAV